MSILDDVSSAVSAITPGQGALATGVMNFLGTQSTNEDNASRADSANVWSAEQYGKRYQTMVKDLEAAGLNPMLAYSQSPGSAPTAQQVTFQNPMSAATQGYAQSAQSAQFIASANQADKQGALIDATVDKVKKETRNLDDEQTRLKAAYINLAEQSALLAQQGHTEVLKRQVLDATAKKLVAERLITQAEYDAMVKTGFIGVAAREVKVLSDVSSEWVDKLLPWRQGKSITTEDTVIHRDSQGREVGRQRYRSTK